MEITDLIPIMIYDNSCYYCSKFASIVKILARKRILILGQYSKLGLEVKAKIFPRDYDATRMFWFITDKVAYGGRAGIFPLLLLILRGRRDKPFPKDEPLVCGSDCNTPQAFFMRIKTLLSSSDKIALK